MQGGRGLAHEAPVPLVNSAMPSTVWLGLSRAGSMLSSAWDGVSELFERGVNWVQGEGFNSNKEIAVDAALAAFHEMGVQEAIQSALQEFGTQQAQEVLKSFYNDSKEVTEAKVWALKQAGYDTTKLEAAIAKRRQAIEEKTLATKEQDIKQRNTESVPVKEVGLFTSFVNIAKQAFDKIKSFNDSDTKKQYLQKVYDVAEDVVNDADVRPYYTNEYGVTGTWCNKGLDRMLDRLGVRHDTMLSNNPGTGKPDIEWTKANDMAKNLDEAARKANNGVVLIESGKAAQEFANKGYAVVAAWYNPKGSGHVALVIPDAGQYNETFGPKIAQAGAENFGPKDNKYIVDGFGNERWNGGLIKFYMIK